ncbi:hypothetical protein EN824_07480 [Mesorhizobium sp. M8A.F.Ca.ET.181.01.1.1]|nr:hypothetical protein EN825_00645 [Mesorhizobium sp. M8A.F.Ca.ET.182.01.1.1]TGS84197.1 hypothetical protein EN824_07480 [Mesorhizobium sp. M8A.F.Ca.ET.181.01.1.1]
MQLAVLVAASLLPASSIAHADSAGSAALVCAASKAASGPCSFSTAKRRVYVALDILKKEAKPVCAGMLVSLMQHHISFPEGRWALEIRSPAGVLLIRCPLP